MSLTNLVRLADVFPSRCERLGRNGSAVGLIFDLNFGVDPTRLSFASVSKTLNGKTVVLRESQNQRHSPVGTDLPSRCFRGGLA